MTSYQISTAVGAFVLLIVLTLLMDKIQRPTNKEINDLRRDVEEFSKRMENQIKDGQK